MFFNNVRLFNVFIKLLVFGDVCFDAVFSKTIIIILKRILNMAWKSKSTVSEAWEKGDWTCFCFLKTFHLSYQTDLFHPGSNIGIYCPFPSFLSLLWFYKQLSSPKCCLILILLRYLANVSLALEEHEVHPLSCFRYTVLSCLVDSVPCDIFYSAAFTINYGILLKCPKSEMGQFQGKQLDQFSSKYKNG